MSNVQSKITEQAKKDLSSHPLAWAPTDLREEEYLTPLTPDDVAAIEGALQHFKGTQPQDKAIFGLTDNNFDRSWPLPYCNG
jgi:hypothetical protein